MYGMHVPQNVCANLELFPFKIEKIYYNSFTKKNEAKTLHFAAKYFNTLK
jgi:hypothetical protein